MQYKGVKNTTFHILNEYKCANYCSVIWFKQERLDNIFSESKSISYATSLASRANLVLRLFGYCFMGKHGEN